MKYGTLNDQLTDVSFASGKDPKTLLNLMQEALCESKNEDQGRDIDVGCKLQKASSLHQYNGGWNG